MKKEGEYIPKKSGFVRLIESNRTVKTTSTFVGVVGLSEMVLNLDQSSEDLTRVFAITVLAFVTSALFGVQENLEKTK